MFIDKERNLLVIEKEKDPVKLNKKISNYEKLPNQKLMFKYIHLKEEDVNKVIERLNILKDECIIIEDSLEGLPQRSFSVSLTTNLIEYSPSCHTFFSSNKLDVFASNLPFKEISKDYEQEIGDYAKTRTDEANEKITDWQWILVREKNGDWIILTSGYC